MVTLAPRLGHSGLFNGVHCYSFIYSLCSQRLLFLSAAQVGGCGCDLITCEAFFRFFSFQGLEDSGCCEF